jgi:hypothetical protein
VKGLDPGSIAEWAAPVIAIIAAATGFLLKRNLFDKRKRLRERAEKVRF